MKYLSKSADQTIKIAYEFARNLPPASIVGLTGDLGAGKTTFIQGMARGLGIDSEYYVNSPTFTLVNEYRGRPRRGQGTAPLRLVHVDLYRIERPLEGESLGLDEYLASGVIVAVEWIERMPALEGIATHRVVLRQLGPKEREITILSPA